MKKLELYTSLMLLLVVSIVLTIYLMVIEVRYLPEMPSMYSSILSKTAESPYRYRILVPILFNVVTQLATPYYDSKQIFLFVFMYYSMLSIYVILFLMYRLLRSRFSMLVTYICVLGLAVTLPPPLRGMGFSLWSFFETIIFILAISLINQSRWVLYGVLIAIASTNRETAIFLSVLYFVSVIDKKNIIPVIKQTGIYFLIWVVIYGTIHTVMGNAPHAISLGPLLQENLLPENIRYSINRNVIFLGPFWLLAILGIRRAPEKMKRPLFMFPPYFLMMSVFGVWSEVRLLMPLIPIVIPLAAITISNIPILKLGLLLKNLLRRFANDHDHDAQIIPGG